MTTQIAVTDIADNALSPSDKNELIRLQGLTIATPEDARDASDGLAFAGVVRKGLEEMRLSLTRPLDAKKRKIIDIFKRLQKPAAEAERHLKARLLTWHQKQEAEAAAERKRLAEAAAEQAKDEASKALDTARTAGLDDTEAADIARDVATDVVQEAMREAPKAATTTKGDLGASTIRKTWTYEEQDLARVPHCVRTEGGETIYLLKLDGAAVNKAIRAGVREIAGLRIYQKASIAGRSA